MSNTTARSVLAEDLLPLIDDEVTIEHLLAHRFRIGDYVDEDLDLPITDHVLTIPVHEPRDDRGPSPGARWLPEQVPTG